MGEWKQEHPRLVGRSLGQEKETLTHMHTRAHTSTHMHT